MKWDRIVPNEQTGEPALYIKTLFSLFGLSVRLHKITQPDAPEQFHTHPGFAIRLILAGGYSEEMFDGRIRYWRPGRLGIVCHSDCHRINSILSRGPSYSLWIRGKTRYPTMLRGAGWPAEWQDRPALGAKPKEN